MAAVKRASPLWAHLPQALPANAREHKDALKLPERVPGTPADANWLSIAGHGVSAGRIAGCATVPAQTTRAVARQASVLSHVAIFMSTAALSRAFLASEKSG
jgi:hypothetical protein